MSSGKAVSFTTTTTLPATASSPCTITMAQKIRLFRQQQSTKLCKAGTTLREEPFHKSNTKRCAVHSVSGKRLCIPAVYLHHPFLLASISILHRFNLMRNESEMLYSYLRKKCMYRILCSLIMTTTKRRQRRKVVHLCDLGRSHSFAYRRETTR